MIYEANRDSHNIGEKFIRGGINAYETYIVAALIMRESKVSIRKLACTYANAHAYWKKLADLLLVIYKVLRNRLNQGYRVPCYSSLEENAHNGSLKVDSFPSRCSSQSW